MSASDKEQPVCNQSLLLTFNKHFKGPELEHIHIDGLERSEIINMNVISLYVSIPNSHYFKAYHM